MNAFSRILVTVDGSEPAEKAFDAAMQISRSLNTEAILVHVVPTPMPGDGIGPSALEARRKL